MKKYYIHFISIMLLFIIFSSRKPCAQQLSPFVISSSGGMYTNDSGMLSFTTGEMAAVETFASATNILTQGFQQSWDFGVATDEQPDTKFSISIYPNPSDGNFNMMTTSGKQVDVSMKIISLLGVEIYREDFYQESKTNIHPIQLSGIPQGIYMIMVFANDKNTGEEYQFVTKINIAR